jgi:hypothetical protein
MNGKKEELKIPLAFDEVVSDLLKTKPPKKKPKKQKPKKS